jgi:putative spermidine/putrescine transport system substrate-binding protein
VQLHDRQELLHAVHASDESYWKNVYYWTTPTADCGGKGGTCKTQQDWVNAWTEIAAEPHRVRP